MYKGPSINHVTLRGSDFSKNVMDRNVGGGKSNSKSDATYFLIKYVFEYSNPKVLNTLK